MSEKDPEPPIQYRNYSDDRPDRRWKMGSFISGMALGIFVVTVFGCFSFQIHPNLNPTSKGNFGLVSVFGCVAIITAVSGAVILRSPRRRFFLAGFLLGMALTSIIEGVCYFG